MNKNEARIAKLEGRFGPAQPLRFIIRFVGAKGSGDPDWAAGGGKHLGDGSVMCRRLGEDAATFEARARQRFPEGMLYLGADPEGASA